MTTAPADLPGDLPPVAPGQAALDLPADLSIEQYLTQLLDLIGVPATKKAFDAVGAAAEVEMTLRERHALMMGRYTQHVALRDQALAEAERSNRALYLTIKKAERKFRQGNSAAALALLTKVVTVVTATKALQHRPRKE